MNFGTLRAVPVGLFAADFDIDASGQRLLTLDLSGFRSRGTFTWQGATYELRAAGLTGRRYTLRRDEEEVAVAERLSLLRRRYRVVAGDRSLELGGGFLLTRWRLREGDADLGEITRDGFFTRAMTLALSGRLPMHVQVFLLAIALLESRRQRRRNSG